MPLRLQSEDTSQDVGKATPTITWEAMVAHTELSVTSYMIPNFAGRPLSCSTWSAVVTLPTVTSSEM